MFRNYYYCEECKEAWTDEWTGTCNDRCPTCGREHEPEESREILPPDALDVLQRVAILIDSTYARDEETGERIENADSPVSASDVVAELCQLEPTLTNILKTYS